MQGSHEIAKIHACKAIAAGMQRGFGVRDVAKIKLYIRRIGKLQKMHACKAHEIAKIHAWIAECLHKLEHLLAKVLAWDWRFLVDSGIYTDLDPKILALGGSFSKSEPQTTKKSSPWGLFIQIWATNQNSSK